MLSLKKTLNSPINLEWFDPDPCKWNHVVCSGEKRVTRIQIGHKNLQGTLPLNLSVLTQLERLELQWNNISGPLPSLSGLSSLQLLMLNNNLFISLWVNGQRSKMSGGIDVIKNMTILKEIWLHSNSFLGPLPDFSGLKNLESLSLRDNSFTGLIPISLVNLESLKAVNLTNNFLQRPIPEFKSLVKVDMTKKTNSFCLDEPGNCDSRVNSLLSIVKSMGCPSKFGENWKGNDPCADRPPKKILTIK